MYSPDQYKTQEMCKKVVLERSFMLHFVPDQYKIQEICARAAELQPYVLAFVPDQYKRHRCWERAILEDLRMLQLVRDWIVT